MKSFWLISFLLLLSLSLPGQEVVLKGRVVDNHSNEPLEFVNVFLNNTTFGTVTNEHGEFSISLPADRYEMIVSFIGYEPIVYELVLGLKNAPLLFKMNAKEHFLEEVEVNARRDSSWYNNLEVFKDLFLGKSRVAKKCKLLNPEVLMIMFDPSTGLLEVKAKDLLQIENPVLGYRIHYLLNDFKYFTNDQYVSFLGYPRFEEKTGNKFSTKRYERNRAQAYNGSVMHFVRSLREEKLEEEGFILRRLVRKPNPNRPTEEEIKQAKEIMRTRGQGYVVDENDPVAITLSKSNLPKMVQYLDKNHVPYEAYLKKDKQEVSLEFGDYFQVVYTGEKEEMAYVEASMMFNTRRPTFQTSVISLRSDKVILEHTGSIIEPLDIVFEGYWGWEKVGDMLPLDYQERRQ